MTANLLTVCPPHNLAVQKQLSNYKNTKESTKAYSLCSEMLHRIRYDKDLDAPPNAQHVLDWFISKTESINNSKENIYNKVYGITFANVETIAEETGYSVSTIEKGFAWLRKMGFVKSRRTRGTAYKVFEAIDTVMKIIKNYIKALFKCIKDSVTGQSTGHFTGHFTGLKSKENAQIPCESKDENQNDPEHIKAFKENPLNKTNYKINNRIENDNPKRYKINQHLKTVLELHPFFTALEKDKQYQVANKFQLAFKTEGMDFQDRDCMNYVLEAYRRFINDIEKGRKPIKKDYYGALYTYLVSAINDYKVELEEQEDEQEEQPSTLIIDRKQQARDRYEYRQQQKRKPQGFFGLFNEFGYDVENATADEFADFIFNDGQLPLKPEERERKDITEQINFLNEPRATKAELDEMGIY